MGKKLDHNEVATRLQNTNFSLVGEYQGKNKLNYIKCKLCGREYWRSLSSIFYGDNNSCGCIDPSAPLTQQIVENRLKDLNFILLQDYTSVSDKHKLLCKLCNNICYITLEQIFRKDERRTRSCGCINKVFDSYKYIHGHFVNTFKLGADIRNIYFNITAKDIWEQSEKQNRKCFFTGLHLTFPILSKDRTSCNGSVDRIDSKIGYIPNNIQLVHKKINLMKQDMTQYEFLNFCHLITNYKK